MGARDEPYVIDGGDSGCGELLMRMRLQMRDWPDGTVVRIVSTDNGAPDDIPVWCRLVGHGFRRATTHDDGRPAFEIILRPRTDPTNDSATRE